MTARIYGEYCNDRNTGIHYRSKSIGGGANLENWKRNEYGSSELCCEQWHWWNRFHFGEYSTRRRNGQHRASYGRMCLTNECSSGTQSIQSDAVSHPTHHLLSSNPISQRTFAQSPHTAPPNTSSNWWTVWCCNKKRNNKWKRWIFPKRCTPSIRPRLIDPLRVCKDTTNIISSETHENFLSFSHLNFNKS